MEYLRPLHEVSVQPDATPLWPILLLSLEVSGAALLLSALVGLPLGVWLGMTAFRGRWLVTVLVRTGMGLPPVLVGLVVFMMLSRSGPLGFLGWLLTPWAMILAQTLVALPIVIGITQAAVSATPVELIQQVKSLGASRWQQRWTMLREARAGVFLALAAAFGRCIAEVGAVLMVGGNIEGHTRVLTTAIVLETSKGQFAVALVLGQWLLVLALLVQLLILRWESRPVG